MPNKLFSSQNLALILYTVLLIFSAVLTGESFARTLDMTDNLGARIGWYLIALVVIGIAYSFLLNLVKKRSDERRTGQAATFLSILVVFWLFTGVYTNAHALFIAISIDDIRKAEVEEAYTSFNTVQENTVQSLGNVEDSLRVRLEGLASKLSQEINREDLPGIGPNADSIIEEFPPCVENNVVKLRGASLAERMKDQVLGLIEGNCLTSLKSIQSDALAVFDNEEHEQIKKDLKDALDHFSMWEREALIDLLERAYRQYNEYMTRLEQLFANAALGKQGEDLFKSLFQQLPERVESVQLERIPNFLPYIIDHPEHKTEAVWSFVIALFVDVLAFLLYYFGYLANRKKSLF